MNDGAPQDDQTLQLSARERIDKVCLAFEDAWKAGEAPAIEPHLVSAADRERPDLLRELLLLELDYRVRRGERPDREEYAARFPLFASVVSRVFQEHGSGLGSTIRRAVAETIAPAIDPDRLAPGFTPGDRIGRYLVKRWLGGGSFGAVYLAEDEDLSRLVAIKVPRIDRYADEAALLGLMDEARTVARLKHPGIVPIYDVGRAKDGRPFVVMEYMEGRTLSRLLKTERLSHERSAELLAAIAEAVGYAHRQGFIHRDLKPGNVLLDEHGRPRVVDFGLAVHEDDQRRRAGEYAGTLPYMAPEQVRRESHRLDGRADIWSLGVMFYQMLTGRLPFSGANAEELTDEILHREPKPPRQIDDKIPPALERIWSRCCAKEIGQRYSSAADLVADLRAFLAGSSSETVQPAPTSRWNGAYVLPAAGGLLALTVVLVLAASLGGWFKRIADNPAKALPTQPVEPAGRVPSAGGAPKIPLDCELDVLIWNPGDRNRRRLPLREPGALPLQPGDQIRVEAKLNRPAYLYLVWIDSEGAVTPFYPWPIGRWQNLPKVQSPIDRLSLPEQSDEGWPMVGPSGMETLLLLARDEPLSADMNLEACFGELPVQSLQDPRSLVWFVDGQIITERQGAERGPSFFDPRRLDDPVLRTQRELGERLVPHFATVRAVSFAKQGR